MEIEWRAMTSADTPKGDKKKSGGNTQTLHDYWTKGEGLAKWKDSPKPWATLYKRLRKYIKDREKAKATAAAWYYDVFGHMPSKHNPNAKEGRAVGVVIEWGEPWGGSDPESELRAAVERFVLARWDPETHPRDPQTGKFVGQGSGGTPAAGTDGRGHPTGGGGGGTSGPDLEAIFQSVIDGLTVMPGRAMRSGAPEYEIDPSWDDGHDLCDLADLSVDDLEAMEDEMGPTGEPNDEDTEYRDLDVVWRADAWVEDKHPRAEDGQFMAYDEKSGKGTGYGKKGGDVRVKDLQRALNEAGFSDLKSKSLDVDGQLGPLTTSAIKKAQKAMGEKPTGKVTPAFIKKLKAMKHKDGKSHGHGGHDKFVAHDGGKPATGGGKDTKLVDDKPASKGRAAPVGEGGRFEALKGKLAAQGAKDPAALAAWIGRRKYGKAKFQQLAEAAKNRKEA